MKKLICVFLMLLVLTSCSKRTEPTSPSSEQNESFSETESISTPIQIVSVPSEPEPIYNYGVFKLNFSENLLYNDSVGNDWRIIYSHNGEILNPNETFTALLDSPDILTIDIQIIENDTFPDIGSGTLSVKLTDGFKNSSRIIITENKSRYYGNTAEWEIGCNVLLTAKK